MYATVADLRAEGVTEAQASTDRLDSLIEEASREIDQVTGWFFEPRVATYRLDGHGTPSLEPPVPPIRLSRLTIDGSRMQRDASHLQIVGAPVEPGFDAPRLTLLDGRRFSRGTANVVVQGTWGYTEDNGTLTGRTPLAIRRACILLVLRWLPLMGDADDAAEARDRWRIIAEKTRDQSYRLDRPGDPGPLTGDPEIDRILMRFRRPAGLGSA
jgi:hypothetical protein